MSLLAGIRYIPKASREEDAKVSKDKNSKKSHNKSNKRSHDERDEESSDDSRNNHKHKSKHHKKHSKEKKKKDNHDDKQHYDKELESQYLHSLIPDDYNSEEDIQKRKRSSILDSDPMAKYLGNSNIIKKSERVDFNNFSGDFNDSEHSSDESHHNDYDKFEENNKYNLRDDHKPSSNEHVPITQPASLNNKSVAEMLREKLKQKTSTSVSVIPSQPHESLLPYMSHADTSRLTAYLSSNKNNDATDSSGAVVEDSIRRQHGNIRGNNKKNGTVNSNEEDNMSIQEMLVAEKSRDGMDDVFVKNLLRLGDRYKGTELGSSLNAGNSGLSVIGKGKPTGGASGADEVEENEIDMKMFRPLDEKLSKEEMAKRIVSNAHKESAKLKMVSENCYHCTSGRNYKSYLTISTGLHTMLRLKPGNSSI
jgi:hypothetical protein